MRFPRSSVAITQAEPHYLEALVDMPRYHRWIAQSFVPYLGGRALEVGAGIGNFSYHLLPFVREAVLVEPNAALSVRLEERFAGAANVRVVHGFASKLLDDHDAENSFDCIVAVNVLEHIPDDVAELRTWCRFLRPSGAVLLFVPAGSWLFGSLDAAVEHVRRYDRRTLRAALASAGLDIVRLKYFDAPGVIPWFILGRLLHTRHFSRSASSLYDRIAVPAISRAEEFVAPPFGKDLVCAARLT